MKKTEVYVVVDTPKKAKNLKRVLSIFDIEWHINQFYGDFNYFYFEDDDLYSIKIKPGLSKVSIKELRNILAKEHLKDGDVCLFDDRKGFKSIGVFDKYSEEYTDFLVSKVPGKDSVRYGFHDFIRYATEGEKALLGPIDDFTDSDLAIVERLHDTLIDNHGYSLESKLLTDARMLASKIKSNIK